VEGVEKWEGGFKTNGQHREPIKNGPLFDWDGVVEVGKKAK